MFSSGRGGGGGALLLLLLDDLLFSVRPDAQFGDELLQLALLQVVDGFFVPSIDELLGVLQAGKEDVISLKMEDGDVHKPTFDISEKTPV